MWPFRRRKSTTNATPADPQARPGPQLVRRTEITVEREWTSTTVRQPGVAAGEQAALAGWKPAVIVRRSDAGGETK